MPKNIYEALWIFLIYAFLGWCAEVAFAAVDKGKFVNRGFLNGPVCPIYGFGMLIVVSCLWRFRHNFPLLFLGSALLTTALEFVTGFVLEKFFNDKWWDYSDMPFNIKGYVCLKFSLLWGLAASLIIGGVHRAIYMFVVKTPVAVGVTVLAVLLAAFAADTVITVIGLTSLPRRLKAMLEAEKALRAISDKLGENISETTLAVKKRSDAAVTEAEPRLEELRAEYERLKREFAAKFEQGSFVHRRILKAFPHLKRGRYKAVFERIGALRGERNNEKDSL